MVKWEENLNLSVKQVGRDTENNSKYEIYSGTTLVARYRHDFRGDEQRISFIGGQSEDPPFTKSSDFLTGGGPMPLGLSDAAIAYLTKKIKIIIPAPCSRMFDRPILANF